MEYDLYIHRCYPKEIHLYRQLFRYSVKLPDLFPSWQYNASINKKTQRMNV